MAVNHAYISGTYAGVELRIIKTYAHNLKIMTLKRNSSLKNSSEFGINGGFFDMTPLTSKNILSIAVNDGYVIGSEPAPKDGSNNNFIGCGAISYNGSTVGYHTGIQNANQISGILGSGKSGTWAQGGRLMSLGSTNWKILEPHRFQDYTEKPDGQTCLVTRLAPPETPLAYLITTYTKVTYIDFRKAVQAYLGISDTSTSVNYYYKGIWLDGGESAQLRAKDSSNNVKAYGGSRKLNSIVALRNKN